MEIKTAEPNLRDHSSLADASREQFNEVDLYDDLLIFSDLPPEQQEAASNSPAPVALSDMPAQTPVEINDPIAAIEQQAPVETREETPRRSTSEASAQTDDAFLFEPPQQQAISEAAIEMREESAVEVVKETAPEPASEPDCAPPQTPAFGKYENVDSQLAEILRITGPLANLVKKQRAVPAISTCANCGSEAGKEEMFCINCGGLLDEAESAAESPVETVALSCDECGSAIESDEIFCPSCGSVMPNA